MNEQNCGAYKQYDCVVENMKEYLSKLLELIKKFRKGTTHKISMYYFISATTQLESPVFKKNLIYNSNKSRKKH